MSTYCKKENVKRANFSFNIGSVSPNSPVPPDTIIQVEEDDKKVPEKFFFKMKQTFENLKKKLKIQSLKMLYNLFLFLLALFFVILIFLGINNLMTIIVKKFLTVLYILFPLILLIVFLMFKFKNF